ncbi:MAG: hypothetical protein IJD22_04510 [Clostridia bacterium]|nr:hypothetical protein [Clostridia bacterium]
MNIKRYTLILLAFLLIFSLFGCGETTDGEDKYDLTSAPAVWSEHTIVTQDMFVYYYNGYYRYFLESNSNDLSRLGLDPSQPLSSQQQSEEYTWQQYITLQVYRQLREMIALADAAKAEGMELSDDDNKAIDSQVAAYDTMAAEAKMSSEQYIEKVYGKGVTKDVMKDSIELRFLANKYYEKLWGSYVYTDEECLSYYEENREDFLHFDYISATVPPEEVDAIVSATDEESFIDALRESITRTTFMDDYERFSNSIEDQLTKKYHYMADIDLESELCQWVMEEERVGYDIHTKTEESGDVTVSMVLPTDREGAVSSVVYRVDDILKNFKYIIFEDSEGTTGAVKADTIYKNWQEEPTESRFDYLCNEHGGSSATNVLREHLSADICDWVFAEERKAGDCEVITVDGGAYLLYMMEDSGPSWMEDVKSTLSNDRYVDDVNAIIDKYPTEYDPDIVYNIVEVSVVESENAVSE